MLVLSFQTQYFSIQRVKLGFKCVSLVSQYRALLLVVLKLALHSLNFTQLSLGFPQPRLNEFVFCFDTVILLFKRGQPGHKGLSSLVLSIKLGLFGAQLCKHFSAFKVCQVFLLSNPGYLCNKLLWGKIIDLLS